MGFDLGPRISDQAAVLAQHRNAPTSCEGSKILSPTQRDPILAQDPTSNNAVVQVTSSTALSL